jgi:hypothetical protein
MPTKRSPSQLGTHSFARLERTSLCVRVVSPVADARTTAAVSRALNASTHAQVPCPKCFGQALFGRVQSRNMWAIMDEVRVPDVTGDFVLRWRWDCEQVRRGPQQRSAALARGPAARRPASSLCVPATALLTVRLRRRLLLLLLLPGAPWWPPPLSLSLSVAPCPVCPVCPHRTHRCVPSPVLYLHRLDYRCQPWHQLLLMCCALTVL